MHRRGPYAACAAFLVVAGAAVQACSAPAATESVPGSAPKEGVELVTLRGNTHPLATLENSLGRVEPGFRIDHMQLVLKRSPAQEAALVTLIDELHDKTSPRFQKWLSVEEFAAYSPSELEVAKAVRWLEQQGFTVDSVAPSRLFIEYSGTAAQVSAAFHTEIHDLSARGARHFGNMSDPQIPKELADIVVGPHSLHNFMPHSMRKDRGQVKRDGATGKWGMVKRAPGLTLPYGECASNADCTSNNCNTTTGLCVCTQSTQCSATLSGAAASCNTTTDTCVQCRTNADCFGPATCNTATSACEQTLYAVTPADFATIYNLNPLFAEGITGLGQTVYVLEDTFLANPSDVATFRAAFGLASYGGSFTQTTIAGTATCTNPGVNGDEGEAALDAEWAGATAPAASVVLAACADGNGTSNTVFGGYLALENLVNGATAPSVVSMSYGECESGNGTTANQAYSNLYQQATAEGWSVFVSTGDEGAASCDANKTVATHAVAVSGFASTPYNVAVGGTDFGDYYNSENGGPAQTTYWSATNTGTFGSALSYVPEVPWNDSCASKLLYSTPSIALGTYTQAYGAAGFCNSAIGKAYFRTTGAASGGPSNAATAAGVGWPQPSWQTGVVGLPTKSGGVRNLPDVSLFAANGVFGHFLVYCLTDTGQGGGPCTYTSTADTLALAAGGTSFASPSMAGIQALINQKMGGAQGLPNYTYYKLAAAEQGPRGSARCNASTAVLPDPACIFNDVTLGDIAVNCANTRTTTNPTCFGQSGSGGTAVDGVLSTSSTALAPAFAAGTGWDFATGLGTPNVYNLVTAWSK